MPRYSKIPRLIDRNSLLRENSPEYMRTVVYPLVPNSPNDIFIITEFGDRLDSLARKFYKDNSLYWIIYNANPNIIRPDQLFLPAGVQLRIPTSIIEIKRLFDEINVRK